LKSEFSQWINFVELCPLSITYYQLTKKYIVSIHLLAIFRSREYRAVILIHSGVFFIPFPKQNYLKKNAYNVSQLLLFSLEKNTSY